MRKRHFWHLVGNKVDHIRKSPDAKELFTLSYLKTVTS